MYDDYFWAGASAEDVVAVEKALHFNLMKVDVNQRIFAHFIASMCRYLTYNAQSIDSSDTLWQMLNSGDCEDVILTNDQIFLNYVHYVIVSEIDQKDIISVWSNASAMGESIYLTRETIHDEFDAGSHISWLRSHPNKKLRKILCFLNSMVMNHASEDIISKMFDYDSIVPDGMCELLKALNLGNSYIMYKYSKVSEEIPYERVPEFIKDNIAQAGNFNERYTQLIKQEITNASSDNAGSKEEYVAIKQVYDAMDKYRRLLPTTAENLSDIALKYLYVYEKLNNENPARCADCWSPYLTYSDVQLLTSMKGSVKEICHTVNALIGAGSIFDDDNIVAKLNVYIYNSLSK